MQPSHSAAITSKTTIIELASIEPTPQQPENKSDDLSEQEIDLVATEMELPLRDHQ